MLHAARKLVIITESSIQARVTAMIEAAGAGGWTAVRAGGKGDRGVRSGPEPGVAEAFGNVKVEVILADPALAERLAGEIAEAFFEDYAGIVYLEDVQILRPHKFR